MSCFIPEKDLQLIVSSWIRLWESVRVKVTQNVWTSSLSKIIISYSKNDLYFDESLRSENLEVKQNTVTNKSSSYACIFCKHVIKSGSHHWKLKVFRWVPHSWTFSIGLSRVGDCNLSSYLKGYGISCQGLPYAIATLNPNSPGAYHFKIGKPLENNDVLDFFMDLDNNKFYMLKNNNRLYYTKEQPFPDRSCPKSLESVYSYDEQEYRFGISFYSQSKGCNCIEMISYDYDTFEDYKKYTKVDEKINKN